MPTLPDGATFDALDKEARRGLLSLPKQLAEFIGAHLVAAGMLVDVDPEEALAHARHARKKASRVAIVRETAGLVAYHAGEWQEAISDLRAVRRMSGEQGYLAVLADCERALGRPERALEIAADARGEDLSEAEAVELRIVAAGARRDLGQLDAAVVALQGPQLDPTRTDPWIGRLCYAYADNLAAAGRTDEAIRWFLHAAEADVDEETDAGERAIDLAESTGEISDLGDLAATGSTETGVDAGDTGQRVDAGDDAEHPADAVTSVTPLGAGTTEADDSDATESGPDDRSDATHVGDEEPGESTNGGNPDSAGNLTGDVGNTGGPEQRNDTGGSKDGNDAGNATDAANVGTGDTGIADVVAAEDRGNADPGRAERQGDIGDSRNTGDAGGSDGPGDANAGTRVADPTTARDQGDADSDSTKRQGDVEDSHNPGDASGLDDPRSATGVPSAGVADTGIANPAAAEDRGNADPGGAERQGDAGDPADPGHPSDAGSGGEAGIRDDGGDAADVANAEAAGMDVADPAGAANPGGSTADPVAAPDRGDADPGSTGDPVAAEDHGGAGDQNDAGDPGGSADLSGAGNPEHTASAGGNAGAADVPDPAGASSRATPGSESRSGTPGEP